MATYYIGTSGWHYQQWSGIFYPQTMPVSQWLQYYSRSFNSVEINSSFYHLPTEKTILNWHSSVPDGFRYSVKVSRYITHIKKLSGSLDAIANFTDRVNHLAQRLGILLFQLPPGMRRNDEKLESLLMQLSPRYKYVFEFRNRTWMDDDIFALLSKYNIGFCIYDLPGYTSPTIQTSDFIYIRFHGSNGLYSSCYSDSELAKWAKNIKGISRNASSIYIYFNNDFEAYAVQNAIKLRQLLRVKN